MGLPAKSGVSGIIIVVVPNVVGFATYSPNLDTVGKGNAAQICTVAISLVHQKTVMEKINWLKQSLFFFFVSQEYELEASFLHSWDFTVILTVLHPLQHPSKCIPWHSCTYCILCCSVHYNQRRL